MGGSSGNPFSGLGSIFSALGSGSGQAAGAGSGGGSAINLNPNAPAQATSNLLTNPSTLSAAGGDTGEDVFGQQSGQGNVAQPPTPPGQGGDVFGPKWFEQATKTPQPVPYAQLPPEQQPDPSAGTQFFDPTTGQPEQQQPDPSAGAQFFDPTTGQPAAVGTAPTGPAAAPAARAPQRRPAPAPARAPAPTGPDLMGSSRESGMAPTTPGYYDPRGEAAAGAPAGGGQQQSLNPLQAIADLLLGGPQRLSQDLQGLNRQAGPAYGAPHYGPQGETRTAPAAQAPIGHRPADDMPPGSAAAAVRAGYDQAARAEGTAPDIPRQPPTGIAGLPPDYFQRHGGQVGANLETINTPYGRVTANRQVAGDFQALTQEMQQMGIPGIHGFGSYNPRQKRYGRGYSSHAYGAAFDINNEAGPMRPETQAWINQHPREWQDLLRRHNFVQYMPQKDPNHLEWTGPGRSASLDPRSAAGAQAAGTAAGPAPRPPADIPQHLAQAGPNYANTLFDIEGGGNINAGRSGSNRGIAQFSPDQERQFGITNRRDINQERRAVEQEAQQNTQHLTQAGVEATPANLYLLHQQGSAGGTALLRAAPTTPAWQAVRGFYRSDAEAQRAIHGNIPGDNPLRNVPASQITSEQFRSLWQNRFNQRMQRDQQASRGPIHLASSDNELSPDLVSLVNQANTRMPGALSTQTRGRGTRHGPLRLEPGEQHAIRHRPRGDEQYSIPYPVGIRG